MAFSGTSTADTEGHGRTSSMGPGRPTFQLWKVDEIPKVWADTLRHPDTSYLAIEVPDFGFGRRYYEWAVAQLQAAEHGVYLAVMLCNQQDYRGGSRSDVTECLRSLLETGKPPAHFVRILTPEAEARAAADGHSVFSFTATRY